MIVIVVCKVVIQTSSHTIKHLATLDGCTCAFEEWVYGGRKVPYSHELAHLMLIIVKLKQRIFKRHSSFYWPNIGVGDIENFAVCNLFTSARDPIKSLWPIRFELSEPCCVDCAPTILCEWLSNISDRLPYTTYSYRSRAIYELRYKFGSVYVYSCIYYFVFWADILGGNDTIMV